MNRAFSAKALLAAATVILCISGFVFERANEDLQALQNEVQSDIEVIKRVSSSTWETPPGNPQCKEFASGSQSLLSDTTTAIAVVAATGYVKGALAGRCITPGEATRQLGGLKAKFDARVDREKDDYWALSVLQVILQIPHPQEFAAEHFKLGTSSK